MSEIFAEESLNGVISGGEDMVKAALSPGGLIINDYVIRLIEIEKGFRMTVTRGSEVQSMDVVAKDGVTPRFEWQGDFLAIYTDEPTPVLSPPLRGPRGLQGVQGDPGVPGDSCTAAVEEIEGGHRITFTNKTSSPSTMPGGSTTLITTETFDVMDGEKGEKGDPGPRGPSRVDSDSLGLPVLYLSGNTAGMSKENAVSMEYAYGETRGNCTLKWQGSSSIYYPKKNYTIVFDSAFEAKEGWGEQQKYCLKANWIDASHARNIVNARIWGEMCASRKRPNPLLQACPNWGAVDGFPICIVLNDEFHGIYTFNIPKDSWMANMGNGDREAILCADGQNEPCKFMSPVTLQGDFELEYVSDENNSGWVLESINKLIDTCIKSDGSNIDTDVAALVDIESAIDYLIFCAVVSGEDMVYKNYLLLTHDGKKWTFGAYDMDCTYGLDWDGSRFKPARHTPTITSYAKGHTLMGLLAAYKADAVKERYAQLRSGILSEEHITHMFLEFACGIPRAGKILESETWPTAPSSDTNTVYQIFENLRLRLPMIDSEVEALTQQIPIEAPMLKTQYNWYDVSASGVAMNTITDITFTADYVSSGNEDASWVCDADGIGEIKAYRTGTKVVVAPTNGARKIRINPDSQYMFANTGGANFAGLTHINGTDMLVASSNTNMYRACYGCGELLEAIVIPKGVNTIAAAFYNCSKLAAAPELPEGVAGMENAFFGCSAMQNMPDVPSTATNMSYTFANCGAVTSIDMVIPANVTKLDGCFANCNNINGRVEINASALAAYEKCFANGPRVAGNKVTLSGTSPLLAELAATNQYGYVVVEG